MTSRSYPEVTKLSAMLSRVFRPFAQSYKVATFSGRCFTSTNANLPNLTPEQIAKIENTDQYLRTRHMEIEGNMSATERDVARRKRMIYRSKQRGWLEADILMGSWASENVPTLSDKDLDEYDTILKEETIDVFNFITGKDPLPDRLKNLRVMKMLQEYAMEAKLQTPGLYEDIKRKNNLT